MRSVRISVLILLAGMFLFGDALTSRAAPLSDGGFEGQSLSTGSPFAAGTTNGFEGSAWVVHDDLPGLGSWRSEANIVATYQGLAPIEDSQQALITTGTGNDSGSTLAATISLTELVDSINAEITLPFVALTASDLDDLVAHNVGDPEAPFLSFEGAAISQRFDAFVGATLEFKWDFLTREASFEDFAFMYLTSAEGDVILDELARTSDATTGPLAGSPFIEHTGTNTKSVVLPGTTAGDVLEYYLVVGVIDQGDTSNDSGLLVDGFFAPGPGIGNPEPASGVLMLLGMIGLALRRRNRRR